ncbi:related to chitin binding protein [Cephalotrichum gorgonifer]|uniref:Related to chitin binding protein n=1 Tax=Cephalotrichum gorgonifer TaxID=2041049 RepID=A0AAE8T038_9PEZI|nr:related to chitin binding protein [Cephalotrichum gorgonifer]
MKSTILAAASLAALVSAHGAITQPPPRLPGAAMAAACGQAAVDAVEADGTIPLENITPETNDCNLFLCRGATFDDNQDLVQTFSAGDVIDMEAVLPIPHEGPANVSIVDTATNTVIGDPLIEFESYADENLPELPANNTAFSVTFPRLPAGACTVAGECVLQWFWFGTGAQQTYESCVDFVVG